MASVIRGSDSFDTASHQLGVGQSWQNLTASRAFGTTYTNNTGRPIFVSVGANNATGAGIQLTVSGVAVSGVPLQAGGTGGIVSGIVPAGATYSATMTAGTAVNITWAELR